MADYDFHQLSPSDLEILTRDLLQAEWGITLENFKTGKDGGIDLRYAIGQDHIVVQCKHYLRTGIKGLLRELKKEAAKMRQMKPTRYVLVTSVPLSPDDKAKAIEVMGSHILVSADVMGQERLNDLLGRHPNVENNHFKLWLASRTVFDRVLNNAAVTKSEFKAQQVYDEVKKYVQSDAYLRALEMLSKDRLVILAGPPGVGKTTLADLLLYEHLEKGFQAVVIHKDIEEGQDLFQVGQRQIFYFDDFMGATFLGGQTSAISGNSDRALLEFISMVRASSTARLVLTTREHIYSQAVDRSERLRHSDLSDFRVFLRMPDYTFEQRARILYNHLYFSNLPHSYQDELLKNEFYLKIIRHEKFNPRIIRWLSTYHRIKDVPVKNYQHFVQHLLNDPSEIWRHAYEQEISDAGRSILLTIFSLGGKTTGHVLKSGFTTLHAERASRYGFATRPEDFRSALREVAGSFIKPLATHGIEIIDPSVLDLMNAVVRAAPANAVDIMASAGSFDQIERLWSFIKAEKDSSTILAIADQTERIVPVVGKRMLASRRVNHAGGAVSYHGPTFERRLIVVFEMTSRLQSEAFLALTFTLFDRLFKEWSSEGLEINDTAELLQAIDGSQVLAAEKSAVYTAAIRSALLSSMRKGCRSDELREAISALDGDDGLDSSTVDAGKAAFEVYRKRHFFGELGECRSSEQFSGLIEDLELFRDKLGVDVSGVLSSVAEARDEYEENQSEYADHMQDEWKERARDERYMDRSLTDLFGSLREDRD